MGQGSAGRSRLSRRALLARAGVGALAGGTASLTGCGWGGWPPWSKAPGPADAPRPALQKGISLGGYGPLVQADHPNDYLLHGNRQYIRDMSRTGWVKLWVSWAHLQEAYRPASRAQSWEQLNTAPGGLSALRHLDDQIAAVNFDSARSGGIGTILTIYQEFPTWSSGAIEADPRRREKPLLAKIPLDLTPDGPWAWFVAHLLARYARGAARNPVGPHELGGGGDEGDGLGERSGQGAGSSAQGDDPGQRGGKGFDPRRGNPSGAFVDAIEVCNEPNTLYWPQTGMPEQVARMMHTAAGLSARVRGPAILAPGLSDSPKPRHETEGATDWRTFTERLLPALDAQGPPAAPVAWSHHNYSDVKDEVSARESQVHALAQLLGRHRWRGDRRGAASGGGRREGAGRLWLTEGGYDIHPHEERASDRDAQARKIERSFREMSRLDEVALWTQHSINDAAGNDFKSALRDDYVPGFGVGSPRPAWTTWTRLGPA